MVGKDIVPGHVAARAATDSRNQGCPMNRATVRPFLLATEGTHAFLVENGIAAELCAKLGEKRPNVVDLITDGKVQLVMNTPRGKASKADDSYIRTAAIRQKVPYVTTIAAAVAAAKGIASYREKRAEMRSLQSYHADIS